jgi:ribosome-binding factor A
VERDTVVSKVRAQRIADRIREELSVILLTGSSDPRLEGVFVTDVEVDRELDFANIYVSALEGSQREKEVLQALIHAQGFLRNELSHRIELRSFPRLRFRWDATEEKAEHIEKLFAELEDEEQSRTAGQNKDSSGTATNGTKHDE